MKNLFIFLYLLSIHTYGQTSTSASPLKAKLIGEWVKVDVRLNDSSKIYNESAILNDLRYKFRENDSVRITYNNQTSTLHYTIEDKSLVINSLIKYEIKQLDDNYLILDAEAIKIILQPSHIHNMGFVPKYYISKGNDTVYTAKRNYLEPLFVDETESAMDYVSSRFYFPDYKAGDFLARFVVTKEGKVRAIEIINSTHENYNEALKKAIKKTEGKWIPATWEGKLVNAEMEMGFDLGWSEKQRYKQEYANKRNNIEEKTEDIQLSALYLAQGNSSFENKAYKRAIQSYNMCLENNHLNIDAYYMRAASYIAIKQIDKACEDLLQLKYLEQKRGENLYIKYCEEKDLKKQETPK